MTLLPGTAPDDPANLILQAVDEIQKQSLRDLGALVARLSEDIAATAVASEASARAKADSLVTQAGEWAALHIRQAGDELAVRIHVECSLLDESVRDLRQTARTLAAVLSAASLSVILIMIVMVFVR